MTRRGLSFCPALCALLLLATACADGEGGSDGELQNGQFGYHCTSDRDPMCGPDGAFPEGQLRTMPNTVAVGGEFGVAFRAVSSAAQDGSALIQPVSSDLLSGGAGPEPTFTALKPGFAGLLALRGSTVVDVIHVRILPIDHVRIDAHTGTSGSVVTGAPSVTVGAGVQVDLSAAAADEGDGTLAGTLDHAWSSDDSSIAEILSSPTTDEISVRGGKAGETTIRATIDGVEGSISVVVPGGPGGSP
ncbi:MAG TPA: Ig-like domain-containing protein [Polyangiaceae bacterium]|nr:Ig-like domain-containing protein [Polyangiaceae bacterium]